MKSSRRQRPLRPRNSTCITQQSGSVCKAACRMASIRLSTLQSTQQINESGPGACSPDKSISQRAYFVSFRLWTVIFASTWQCSSRWKLSQSSHRTFSLFYHVIPSAFDCPSPPPSVLVGKNRICNKAPLQRTINPTTLRNYLPCPHKLKTSN